ncbi:MAG: stage II sporulation protein P [Eubacteriales bacterium]
MGVGDRLAELLTERYGYNVIHNTKVYDDIDGELDRNRAYSLAAEDVKQILAENPTLEVLIRPPPGRRERGYPSGDRGGRKAHSPVHVLQRLKLQQAERSHFLSGKSVHRENLALSLQLKLACEAYYPGVSRKIYLKSLRYNLHLRPSLSW